jgi:hypothetical protein
MIVVHLKMNTKREYTIIKNGFTVGFPIEDPCMSRAQKIAIEGWSNNTTQKLVRDVLI